ncbi:Uncharacterised protein [Mycobacteroides abscessus subsp. abscessus]|nr:Uncharacterised protein [Mycobacteroides abscessus subsp. abscessus]
MPDESGVGDDETVRLVGEGPREMFEVVDLE